MHPAVHDVLLDALTASRIRFVHWKSNHHLPEALSGETDLDVLVAQEQIALFRQTVIKVGAIRILSQGWASYPGVEDWLIHDNNTGRFLHLHVHTQLVTGLKRVKHLILPWADFMLSHKRSDPRNGWPVPQAEVELLVLLIRIWAKMPPVRRLWRPRIPRHIFEELRWLEQQVDARLFKEYASALGLFPPAMPPYADESAVLASARALYFQVRQHRRIAWPVALLRAAGQGAKIAATRFWLRHVAPVRYRKLVAGGGAIVAIIGSDGSGKSTQSQRLLNWLHYKLDAHLLYMGSGDGQTGLANSLRKALSRMWKKRKIHNTELKKTMPAGGAAPFSLKLWRLFDLLLLRRKLRLVRRARLMANAGSIMLLDRYPQSRFPGISDGPRQQHGYGFRWAARMEQRLLAEAEQLGPDMVIKLRVSPDVASTRKPDHDANVIRRKCQIIDELSFPRSETLVLDADAPLESVTLAAQAGLWRFISRHTQS